MQPRQSPIDSASAKSSPSIDPASLRCAAALGTTMVASSRDVGWTSLLVDHDRITSRSGEFDTCPTSDQTIVVMLRGAQEIAVRRRSGWLEARYGAGTVGLTAAGQIDRLRRRVGSGKPMPEKAVLYMPSAFLEEAADHYRRAGQKPWRDTLTALAFNDPAIAAVAVGLVRAVKAGSPDYYAETVARWLSAHLLAAHARWTDIAEDTRDPGIISDRRLQRVLEMIEARLAMPLRLVDLAAEAGVSKFHFTLLFRQAVGQTPCAYLLERRLAMARRLLTTGEFRVEEVAARCGFSRPAYFSSAFARRFGEPPSRYRFRQRG